MNGSPPAGAPVADTPSPGGRFADNLVVFARALRRGGMSVGMERAALAARALQASGLGERGDFYWCLRAVFVSKSADIVVFDEIFHRFWRKRDLIGKMLQAFSPPAPERGGPPPAPAAARAGAALQTSRPVPDRARTTEIEARLVWSDTAQLRARDFEQMSAEEIMRARKAIAALTLPLDRQRQRRLAPAPRGRIDMRASLRAGARHGGTALQLRYRAPIRRPPPLVILCDISGSMAPYARLFLHFAHALTHRRRRVFSFVFGTVTCNITRHMAIGDPDEALSQCGGDITDWSGGTRIAACVRAFNQDWARRTLSGGAVVLFVSDGLERDRPEGLGAAMDRLHRSCRRLIWLNPLLRYEGFEPRAGGVRAILPHVDELRPVHNLQSIETLCAALDDTRRSLPPRHAYAPPRIS